MSTKIRTHRAEFDGFEAHCEAHLTPVLTKNDKWQPVRFRIAIYIALMLIPISIMISWDIFQGGYSKRILLGALILPIFCPMLGFALTLYILKSSIHEDVSKFVASYLGWDYTSKDKKKTKYITKLLSRYGLIPYHDNTFCGHIIHGKYEGTNFVLNTFQLNKTKDPGYYSTQSLKVFNGSVLSLALSVKNSATTLISHRAPAGRNRLKLVSSDKNASGVLKIWSTDPASVETVICERFEDALGELSQSRNSFGNGLLIHRGWIHIPIDTNSHQMFRRLMPKSDSSKALKTTLYEFENVLDVLEIMLRERYLPNSEAKAKPIFAQTNLELSASQSSPP